ncbi:MAG: OmpA family protein [Betaproteobacteria bacterium]|nr:OmpA family protein [Betaproteobacteria bacterium]
MKIRVLVLALMSSGSVLSTSSQAATDCNQLFVYAVQQFCSIAPNGQSLCQPVGLVGPAPTCALPGAAPALTPMLLSPSAMPAAPYSPYPSGSRATNPYLAAPGVAAAPYVPPQPIPIAPQAAAAPVQAKPATPVAAPAVATPAVAAPAAVPVAKPAAAPASPPVAVVKPASVAVSAPVESPKAVPAAARLETAPATPARPVNPYLVNSGITVQPFTPWSPAPVSAPAAVAPPAAAKPAPAVAPAPAPVIPAPAPAPVAVVAPAAKAEPAAAPQPVVVQPIVPVAETAKDAVVLFRFNSSRLTPDARKLLDAWVANAPKGAKVFVTGHADRIGSARYNKKLSLRRAKSVRAYLVSKGVGMRNIVVAAKGYAAPVKNCDGKVSRAIIVCLSPNRRVEVKP